MRVERQAEETADGERAGSVCASRYAQILAELRKPVETAGRIRFAFGDCALEVEPTREYGGQERGGGRRSERGGEFGEARDALWAILPGS
ncbi:hypothetical protein ACWGKQ_24555 [Streptomyces sp. NPDC054770]